MSAQTGDSVDAQDGSPHSSFSGRIWSVEVNERGLALDASTHWGLVEHIVALAFSHFVWRTPSEINTAVAFFALTGTEEETCGACASQCVQPSINLRSLSPLSLFAVAVDGSSLERVTKESEAREAVLRDKLENKLAEAVASEAKASAESIAEKGALFLLGVFSQIAMSAKRVFSNSFV